MEPIGNNWAQIIYHVGTEQETSKLYEFDKNNGKTDFITTLRHFLDYDAAFQWPRRDAENDKKLREAGRQYAEEIAERRKAMELTQEDWERRYTI